MKNDRFLFFILVGILVLVIIALVVFFTRADSLEYVTNSEPDGVVHNYIVALHKYDYDRAFTYLADHPLKPSLDTFRLSFINHEIDPSFVGVEIGNVQKSGNNASVELGILYSSSDPFNSGGTSKDYAQLELQDGEWKIRHMPYYYWAWHWYEPKN